MNAWKNAFVLSIVLFVGMTMVMGLGLFTVYPTKHLITDGLCVIGTLGVMLYTGVKWWRGDED